VNKPPERGQIMKFVNPLQMKLVNPLQMNDKDLNQLKIILKYHRKQEREVLEQEIAEKIKELEFRVQTYEKRIHSFEETLKAFQGLGVDTEALTKIARLLERKERPTWMPRALPTKQ